MARLHNMVQTSVELRIGRNYKGHQVDSPHTWRIEIVDEQSLMRVGLVEMTDAQFGEALGGSPVRAVWGEFIDPAKADRIGKVQYQARAVLDGYDGSLKRMPYDTRESQVQLAVSEQLGDATVYAKHTKAGMSVTVYGYVVDRAGAQDAADGLLAELETALKLLGFVAVNTEAYVSGE